MMAPEHSPPRSRIIHTYSRRSAMTTRQSAPSSRKATRFGKLHDFALGKSQTSKIQNTTKPSITEQLPPSYSHLDCDREATASPQPSTSGNKRNDELRGLRSTVPEAPNPVVEADGERGICIATTPFVDAATEATGGRSSYVRRGEERSPEDKAARLIAYNQMKTNTARQMSLTQALRQQRKLQEPRSYTQTEGLVSLQDIRKVQASEGLSATYQDSEFLEEYLGRARKTNKRSSIIGDRLIRTNAKSTSQDSARKRENETMSYRRMEDDGDSAADEKLDLEGNTEAEEANVGADHKEGGAEEFQSDKEMETIGLRGASFSKPNPAPETNIYPTNVYVPIVGTVSRSVSELSGIEHNILSIGNDSRSEFTPVKDKINKSSGVDGSRYDVEMFLPYQDDLYTTTEQWYDGRDEGKGVDDSAHKKRQRSIDRDTHAHAIQNNTSQTSAQKLKQLIAQGKKKKKIVRELPTESLVFVEERLENSDSDSDEGPLELLDDPISQFSENMSRSKRRKVRHGVEVNITSRTRDITSRTRELQIDYKEYRIPEREYLSPKSRRRRQRECYGDGFNLDESQPIGKTISIRRPYRLPASPFRVKLRFRPLTIVAHKMLADTRDRGRGFYTQDIKIQKRNQAPADDYHKQRVVHEPASVNGRAVVVSPDTQGEEDQRPVSTADPEVPHKISQVGQAALMTPHDSGSPSKNSQNTRSRQKSVAFGSEAAPVTNSQIQNTGRYLQQPVAEMSVSHRSRAAAKSTVQTSESCESSKFTGNQQLSTVSVTRRDDDSDGNSDSQGSYIDEDGTEIDDSVGDDEHTDVDEVIVDLQCAHSSEEDDEDESVSENDQAENDVCPAATEPVERVENPPEDCHRETKRLPTEVLLNLDTDKWESKPVTRVGTEQEVPESGPGPLTEKRKHVSELDIPFSQRTAQRSEIQQLVSNLSNVNFKMSSLTGYAHGRGRPAPAHEVKTHVPKFSTEGSDQDTRPIGEPDLSTFTAVGHVFGYQDYKPQQPKLSQVLMEVDEDIVDSPTPLQSRLKNPKSYVSDSRQPQSSIVQMKSNDRNRSSMGPLTGSRARQGSPELGDTSFCRSQGSLELGSSQHIEVNTPQFSDELGCSQKATRSSSPFVPEMQQLKAHQRQEIPSSQELYEPLSSIVDDCGSYFNLVREALQLPVQRIVNLKRSRSMYASKRSHSPENIEVNSSSGMTPASPYKEITTSSVMGSSSPRLPVIKNGPPKTLASLTRKASQNMGTTSSPRYRGRTKSLHEIPHLLISKSSQCK